MKQLTLAQYQPLALRTAKMYDSVAENLNHAALGIASEWLELQYARLTFDTRHTLEETGDLVWYVALACFALETTMEAVNQRTVARCTNPSYVGDFISFVKRVKIYERQITPDLREAALDNLCLVIRHAAFVALDCSSSLDQVLADNITKLRARYPDAYSNAAAEARADKGGLAPEVS